MSSNTVNQRVNFASTKNPLEYPDFLEVQLKSFQDFLQLDTPPEKRKNEGLYKVFAENFPIADTRNNFVLEFLDYYIDPPRYTIDDCIERGLTYSVPLKAKLKLYCTDPDHEDFDTVIQDVFLGPIPYMTDKATFVINGAERVVVSQLHRSPGVFFGQSVHANGTKLYSARIIPFKGSWIEFATDINNVMYAYIDRKKKLPVTTLLRAIGFENDKDILEIFNLAEDVKVNKTNLKKVLGRKLAARVLKTWIEDFVDEDTGEVVSIERNEVISIVKPYWKRCILMKFWSREFKTSFYIKMNRTSPISLSYIIRCRRTRVTRKKKLCCISTVSCVTPIRLMTQVQGRLSTTCSSLKNDMTLVM